MDVVVPQDIAITVERCLVVVLADVVGLRQLIVVGRTIVAIVDDDIVRIAVDEIRIGRHRAIVCLDRAIDRIDALAADREVGLLDRRAVVEREGTRIFETVVLPVLFAEAVEGNDRVVGILGCILGDDAFRVARQCARTRDRQVTRTVAILAREDCLAEICFRAVDRRVRCVRDEVVDVVFRDVQRRDRCRAIEVRDFIVLQTVDAFALKSIVADILRPLAVRTVKRCSVRVVHATECRIQSCLRIAIRDARFILVPILRFIELRTIDRRRIVNLDRQAGWRDFRLAIHKRDIVIVQRIERGFRSIREHQLIGVAHSRGPFIVCTVKCCFIIVLDFTKLCCQRTFRIAIDQVFARFSTIVIAILLFIKLRTIDRLGIANIDNQIRFFNCSFASQDFRIIVFQVIIKEVSTLRRFKTNRILITSICCPNTIFAISSSGIHVLSWKQAQFITKACVQGFSRITIDNAVRI